MVKGTQLEVLSTLGKARTQWYHLMAIIIVGMGFFTNAYDLFCIPTVTKLLGRLYYPDASGKGGSLPINVNAVVSSVALCGTLAGQLFFGWMGDKLGRKKVYGLTVETNGKSLEDLSRENEEVLKMTRSSGRSNQALHV